MSATSFNNVIQPEIFSQYVIDTTTERTEAMYAGAIENNPELSRLVNGGGTVISMPKWSDLAGNSEVLSENSLTVNGLTAKTELATMLIRGKAWGATELAGALAGDDPMRAIASRVADFWVRDEKKTLLSILKGIFSINNSDSKHPTLDDLVHDISSESGEGAVISAAGVLDAKNKMGDAADLLTMIYMHSATFTALQKQNVIQFIPAAESKIAIPTYLGYRVLVDDSAPVASGVYTTYLLSRGCIQRGQGVPPTLTPTETDRDSLTSTDVLVNRQAKVLHPRGVSWVGAGAIAGATPSDDELANENSANNWARVADIKKIGIVKFVHRIAPAS